ncbi:MAG: UDP-galactopyranose mutase [Methanobacteriaceae archaeon]|nr:UDP-galactopyranose mutase [Methanobacteriaceae archaeon]
MDYDYIIVGAGLAGSTAAQQAAKLHKKVLIIEKRDHIGGNCYDYMNKNGVLVHKYGPHIFHTNNERVYDYLSEFTAWNSYNHKVLGHIDNTLVPIPINIISIDKLVEHEKSEQLKNKLIKEYGINSKTSILDLRKSDDPLIKEFAGLIYEKVFYNYTLKQWDLTPEELNFEVVSRVPIHVSYDCRFFQDTYQGLPLDGYNWMFDNMLSNKNIDIVLNQDYNDRISLDEETNSVLFDGEVFDGEIIFTGMIDELFNYKFGELPYRSVIFETTTREIRDCFQEAGTINYPNDYHFTRITEFKILSQQQLTHTTLCFEFPVKYDKNNPEQNIPYYPIPQVENDELYEKYALESTKYPNMHFVGRLAKYKYLNMDQVVLDVLELFDKME